MKIYPHSYPIKTGLIAMIICFIVFSDESGYPE